jgi:hypothetical protein
MPKYLIEREIPNAAAFSPAELQEIARRSCAVLRQLGPSIQWVQSFVTEDKITCIYIAPNAELVREHARLAGFPADRVLEVATTIDPTTAETSDLPAGAGAGAEA